MIPSTFLQKDNIVLNLHQADFSQADKIAETINDTLGPEVATPLDSTSIKVRTPEKPSQKVSFIGLLENLIEPVTPKAKVVVNSRTGTVVIGGDVRISPAAVAHGSLSVKKFKKIQSFYLGNRNSCWNISYCCRNNGNYCTRY